MRKLSPRYFLSIFLICIISTVFAGALLSDFSASSDGSDITLNWQTTEENNLQHFVIERKSATGFFVDIATVQAKGSNSAYEYVDENAYKANEALYVYRLRLVDNDGSVSYSGEVAVSHSVSSVKRTWGSIKALFR